MFEVDEEVGEIYSISHEIVIMNIHTWLREKRE